MEELVLVGISNDNERQRGERERERRQYSTHHDDDHEASLVLKNGVRGGRRTGTGTVDGMGWKYSSATTCTLFEEEQHDFDR